MASASHAAFNFPRPAGRLLAHCFDRASPAISSMLRLLSTDSSVFPASYPSTTWSSCFLIISHSLPLLPGRLPFILTSASLLSVAGHSDEISGRLSPAWRRRLPPCPERIFHSPEQATAAPTYPHPTP